MGSSVTGIGKLSGISKGISDGGGGMAEPLALAALTAAILKLTILPVPAPQLLAGPKVRVPTPFGPVGPPLPPILLEPASNDA